MCDEKAGAGPVYMLTTKGLWKALSPKWKKKEGLPIRGQEATVQQIFQNSRSIAYFSSCEKATWVIGQVQDRGCIHTPYPFMSTMAIQSTGAS